MEHLNIIDDIVFEDCAAKSLKEIRNDTDQSNKLRTSVKAFSFKNESKPYCYISEASYEKLPWWLYPKKKWYQLQFSRWSHIRNILSKQV